MSLNQGAALVRGLLLLMLGVVLGALCRCAHTYGLPDGCTERLIRGPDGTQWTVLTCSPARLPDGGVDSE